MNDKGNPVPQFGWRDRKMFGINGYSNAHWLHEGSWIILLMREWRGEKLEKYIVSLTELCANFIQDARRYPELNREIHDDIYLLLIW